MIRCWRQSHDSERVQRIELYYNDVRGLEGAVAR